MTPLVWAGRHASPLLLAGFVVVPFLPVEPDRLRPLLPGCVVLVTGLAFARQRLDVANLRALAAPKTVGLAALWLAVSQVVIAVLAVSAGRAAGLDPATLLLIAAFFAAPPLGSAPNICLLLGYDFTLALRLTLVGTALAPVLTPLALAVSGVDSATGDVAVRVLGMLAGGVLLGATIQLAAGPERIVRNGDALNGLAALAMLAFLFPLLAGTTEAIAEAPTRTLTLLALALILNMGGHMVVRMVATASMTGPSARTTGYIFGNRNIAVVLASVPFDPTLTLFVALMQAPIYATPALFSFLDRPRPCPRSSES